MEFLMGKHLEMADFPLPGLITGGQNRNIELAPPTSQWLPYCIVFQSHEMIGHWFHPGRLVLGSLRNLIILFTSGWWKKKKQPRMFPTFCAVGVFHGIFHHNELRSGATPGRWPRDVGGHCVEQAVGVLESGSKTLAQPRWKPSSGCEGCQV